MRIVYTTLSTLSGPPLSPMILVTAVAAIADLILDKPIERDHILDKPIERDQSLLMFHPDLHFNAARANSLVNRGSICSVVLL